MIRNLLIKYIRRQINGLHGFLSFFRLELNAWVLLCITILVLILGISKEISQTSGLFLTVSILMMWISEVINTAIEELADVASPEKNLKIQHSKDMAGFAVFLCYISFIIVFIVVFLT